MDNWRGQLVIPKHHGPKLADIPDDQLSEILVSENPPHTTEDTLWTSGLCAVSSLIEQPVLKKLAAATGATDYNILQNNGSVAHQVVNHVSEML